VRLRYGLGCTLNADATCSNRVAGGSLSIGPSANIVWNRNKGLLKMFRPTVAILGASADRRKFGNKSVRAHLRGGYDVYPVNPKSDEIEGLPVYRALADVPVQQLDRISVYVSPEVGLKLLPEIAGKGAREVWFNPGSESPELLRKARALRLNVVAACSIVDVGVRPDELPDS